MKRTSMMMSALLLLASVVALALPVVAQAVTVNIVSDSTWRVYGANGIDLGNAQNVCLNAGAPSNCPPGATIYGYAPPGGWTANLSGTPQATWIWAPNITGASVPAEDAEFSFKKDFYICGTPQDSTIWVAVDDAAEVILNGTSVLSWNSHSAPGSVNIPAASLNQSPVSNTIEIKVKNGANPSDCGTDEYQCNPAGVIFRAQFADSLSVLPKCPGNADVGTSIPLCTPPQTGRFKICACVAGAAYWLEAGTCMSPPPTNCVSKSVSWIVGSSTCDANYLGGQSGASAAVTDSTAPTTGTATTSCSNGTVTTTAVSCVTTPSVLNNGDICGSSSVGQTGTCVAGTTCGSRTTPGTKPPWWCIPCGIFTLGICTLTGVCQGTPPITTSDWFCDP